MDWWGEDLTYRPTPPWIGKVSVYWLIQWHLTPSDYGTSLSTTRPLPLPWVAQRRPISHSSLSVSRDTPKDFLSNRTYVFTKYLLPQRLYSELLPILNGTTFFNRNIWKDNQTCCELEILIKYLYLNREIWHFSSQYGLWRDISWVSSVRYSCRHEQS